MVDNVIENAVRHNQPQGSITVALEPRGEQARLVVESGGPFLDPATVARLAEPFKRLGADRTGSENGHGLGLSIVAAVAAAHDGTPRATPPPPRRTPSTNHPPDRRRRAAASATA